MKLPETKKFNLVTTLVVAALGILLGILLLSLNADLLLKIIFVVMGIVTVLSAIPALLSALFTENGKASRLTLISSLLSVVLGILMICWHSGVLMVILGFYMLVLPLLEIILSHNKKQSLIGNLPQMIIGVLLILIGPGKVLHVILKIAGWAVIALSALYAVVVLLSELRRQTTTEKTTGNRVFVDETGDGKVDTVYVDTTGDGKPDTAKRYRDRK